MSPTSSNRPIPAQGIAIANGLGFCITGANALNDSTTPTTGVNLNIGYK